MTIHADIAADVAREPQPLAYATADTDITLTDLEPALSRLLGVAVLSGMCVGSCFLLLYRNALVGIIHFGIYGAILVLAVRAGVELGKARFSRPGLWTLDTAAGLGLVIIGLAPLGIWLFPHDDLPSGIGALALAVAFGLLAVTSVRHRDFYRKLSYPVRAAGYRKTAVWLHILGWTKSIFETLWLFCCTLPLLVVGVELVSFRMRSEEFVIFTAFAAFFGCLGYAVVWVAMIVLHARVLRLSRIRRASGFEVLMPKSVIA